MARRRVPLQSPALLGGALLAAVLILAGTAGHAAAEEMIPLAAWQDPPRELRPVARWWWPGGSVEAEVLTQQLQQIRDAGFGGVELQPLLLGLGKRELGADARLRSVGEPAFRERVAHAAAEAARLGLSFDLTLGSGWPGGLPTSKRNAERQLVMGTAKLRGPARFEGRLPEAPDQSYRRAVEWLLDVLGPQDTEVRLVAVLAGRLGKAREGVPVLEEVRDLRGAVSGDQLAWDVPAGDWRLFAIYENATEHFVMGGAFPGEEADARVVDHLTANGADVLIRGYGDPLLEALEPGQVREIFVDSFELLGELPISTDFLAAFRARAGYDLTPHLPLVFRKGGESKYGEMLDLFGRKGGPRYLAAEPGRAERIREDYERVRRLLFEERFVGRLTEWAHSRGSRLRLQAHGGYGDYLDSYARADVPESEALFGGGSYDFLKLAASAAHVAGRRWASSESFITLRLRGTRLSRGEMHLLAGRAYAAGINRLAFHGVPYPYTRADGKAWYPFSGGFGRILAGPLPMSSRFDAAALRELPDFNRFLGRLTLAMSLGEPVAEVAWLRAEPGFPDEASFQIGRIDPHDGESPSSRALRSRGLGHDRVSRRMLAAAQPRPDGSCQIGARRYQAVLLDPLAIAEPELAEKLVALAETGIPVLALGALPQRAPGLRDAKARDQRVRAATKRLAELVVRVKTPKQLAPLLEQYVANTLVEPPSTSPLEVSLQRRRTASGEILLVFNESWSRRSEKLRFTRGGGILKVWDPMSASRKRLQTLASTGKVLELDLEAGQLLMLTVETRSAAQEAEPRVDPNTHQGPSEGDSNKRLGSRPFTKPMNGKSML